MQNELDNMTEELNKIKKQIKHNDNSFVKSIINKWSVTVRESYTELFNDGFINLLSGEFNDKAFEKVNSSYYARVYRYKAGENTFYIKQYLYRSFIDKLKHLFRKSRAKRAFDAGLLLEEYGINTPKIAALITSRDRLFKSNILITSEIQNTKSLYLLFLDGFNYNKSQKILLLEKLGKTIGYMHNSGIYHGDLRGGNVLVQHINNDWNFFLIDNERTCKFKIVPKKLIIKNLVQLNLVIGNLSNIDRMRFLKAYINEYKLDKTSYKTLAREVIKKTNKRLPNTKSHKIKNYKISNLRYCGKLSMELFDKETAKVFMSDIKNILANGKLLKSDTATTVIQTKYNNKDIVIKKYNYQSLWHSFRHTIKGTRAKKCWHFGNILQNANIGSAKVFGYFEVRKYGFIIESYVINEFLEGIPLHLVLNTENYSQSEKQNAIELGQKLLGILKANHLTHLDMKPSNMFVKDNKIFLIDLDSMQKHRSGMWFNYRYNKMVNKFCNRSQGIDG